MVSKESDPSLYSGELGALTEEWRRLFTDDLTDTAPDTPPGGWLHGRTGHLISALFVFTIMVALWVIVGLP